MSERILLAKRHQPSKEEILRAAAEKPVRGVFTLDIHGLHEEDAVIHGYPDCELRNSDIPVRVQVAEGTGRGELLFYLRRLLEEIRDDRGWDYLTFDLRPRAHPDTAADYPVGPGLGTEVADLPEE